MVQFSEIRGFFTNKMFEIVQKKIDYERFVNQKWDSFLSLSKSITFSLIHKNK